MAIDLKTLSPKELQALIASANEQMHEARAAQVQAVRQKIDTLLSQSGLTLDEVYPTRGKRGPGKKGGGQVIAPKYRNPADPAQTWTGRGRQPLWFAKALKRRGVTVEDLLIGGADKAAVPVKKVRVAKKVAKRVVKKAAARKRS